MTLWQRLRRLLGRSYVVRSEPGWFGEDEAGRATLNDGTTIQLYPSPDCPCGACRAYYKDA